MPTSLPPGAVPLTDEEVQTLTPLAQEGAVPVDPFQEFDEGTLLSELRQGNLSHAALKQYALEKLPATEQADDQQLATRLKLARVSEAYKDTGITAEDLWKMAANTPAALWSMGKGIVKTLPKVASVTPGALLAKGIGQNVVRPVVEALPLPKFVKELAKSDTPVIEGALRTSGELLGGLESEGTGLLHMGERAGEKVLRMVGLKSPFERLTNGQILANFDEDIANEAEMKAAAEGKGNLTQAFYGPETAAGSLLANEGLSLRPEEMQSVSEAGLLGLPAFAAGGTALKTGAGAVAKAALPASVLEAGAKVGAAASKATAAAEKKVGDILSKGAGYVAKGTVLGSSAVLDTANFLGKLGPFIGMGVGAVKGGPVGALAGGVAGETISRRIGRVLAPMRKVVKRLDQSGKNLVAGTPEAAGPYGRMVYDVAHATPEFLRNVGPGAMDDVFFALATSETPEEVQNQPMFGTFLRMGPAAGRVARRFVTGQEIAPSNVTAKAQDWWPEAEKWNKAEYGIFPSLDAMHKDNIGKAEEGVQRRVGAMRSVAAKVGGQVFLADPARAKQFLLDQGYTEEYANNAAQQRGITQFNVPDSAGNPQKISLAIEPDSAAHEVKHIFQAAAGWKATALETQTIKHGLGRYWEAAGQDYARRVLPEAALKEAVALGLSWQEALVRFTDRVPDTETVTPEYVRERSDEILGQELGADIYNALVAHGGPELVAGRGLPGKFARILAGSLQALGQEPWDGSVVMSETFDPNSPLQIPVTRRAAEAVRKGTQETPKTPLVEPGSVPPTAAPPVAPAAPTPASPTPTSPTPPTTVEEAQARKDKALTDLMAPFPKDMPDSQKQAEADRRKQAFEEAQRELSRLKQAKVEPTPSPSIATPTPIAAPKAPEAPSTPSPTTPPAIEPASKPGVAAPKSPEAVEQTIRSTADTKTFQIEHAQVERDSEASREQERAAQEVARELPDDVRRKVEKIFTVRLGDDGQPRFVDTSKGRMVIGVSPIQRLANAKRVAKMAIDAKRPDLVPYPTNGKDSLTAEGWKQLHADMEKVQWNHENGWRGDGSRPITVPEGTEAFVPPQTGNQPIRVDQAKADFINLLNGASIAPPKSLRAAPEGTQHANVRAQRIAKASSGVEIEPRVQPLPTESGGFFGGELGENIKGEAVPRAETNPLRKKMAEAGLPIYQVPDVESRIHLKHITDIQARPDIRSDAVSSDVTRAGFSARREEEYRKTGLAFKDFTSRTVRGEFGTSSVPFQPVLDISNPRNQRFLETFSKHSGPFDDHIAKSIPTYTEVQIRKGSALLAAYPAGAKILSIGGSEGAQFKALTEASGGQIRTVTVDPNPDVAKFFAEKSSVPNADFVQAGFLAGFKDGEVEIPAFDTTERFDVVNEGMVFQFISSDRLNQIAEVKRLLKPDGVFLCEEKVSASPEVWKANEAKKDKDFKSKYFSGEDLAAKQRVVGISQPTAEGSVSMVDNMVSKADLEKTLRDRFGFVAQYWDSGNFKGYAASDSPRALEKFLSGLGDVNSEFSTVKTPRKMLGNPRFSARREGMTAKEQADIEKAIRYYKIGHGPSIDRETGKYANDKMWHYDPAQRKLETADTDSTHEGEWGDVSRSYKGRYDDAQKKISVRFPDTVAERIESEGRQPTEDDIPTGVYNSLRRQFGDDAQMVVFSAKRGQFSAAREAGAPKGEEAKAAKLWEEKSVNSPYFKRWFGHSKVRDEEGEPLVVYHGRLKEFDAFDKSKASVEADVGPGFYFTNDRGDSGENYASLDGPDQVLKLEGRIEQLLGEEPYASIEDPAEAYRKAKAEVIAEMGDQPNVLPTYLKMERPVVVSDDPRRSTRWDLSDETEGHELMEAVRAAAYELGGNGNRVWVEVSGPRPYGAVARKNENRGRYNITDEFENGGVVTAQQLLNHLQSADSSFDVGGGGSAIFNEAMRRLGFDGVKIENPSVRYSGMGLSEGTEHYVVFEPEQVKSVDNRGTFDLTDPRFRFSAKRKPGESESEFQTRKDDEALESAERYFAIGHKRFDAIDESNLTPAEARKLDQEKIWFYDTAERRLLTAPSSETHGTAWSHERADQGFKGRYDALDNTLSVVFPERLRNRLGDREPTEDDIPTGVHDALRRKFGNEVKMVVFSAKRGEVKPIEWPKKRTDAGKRIPNEERFSKSSDTRFSAAREAGAPKGEDLDELAIYDNHDRVRQHQADILEEFLSSRKTNPNKRISWPKIPAARLKKIWLDYGRSGVVRDERGMEAIKESVLSGIARLRAATELVGHTERSPQEISEEHGIPLSKKQWEDFYNSDFIVNEFSDYGLAPLERIYDKLFKADTAEEQLHLVDRALNIVHQRGDLAALFVEGGTKTLNEVASQGGYVSPDSFSAKRDEVKPIEWPKKRTDEELFAELEAFEAERLARQQKREAAPESEYAFLKAGPDGFSKAWILPSGKIQQLGPQWHHQWLVGKEDELGLSKKDTRPGDEGYREAFIRKGAVRVNYANNTGSLTVEARQKDWRNKRDSVRKLIESNLDKLDNVAVHLLNDAGTKAVDSDSVRLFKLRTPEEKLAAIPFLEGGSEKVDTEAAEGKEPTPYQQAQAFPDATVFSAKRFTHSDLPEELDKARKGESTGQTFNSDGSVWNPRNKRVDLVTLASVNVPQSQLTKDAVLKALADKAPLLDVKGVVAGIFKLEDRRLRNSKGVYEPAWSIDLNAVVPQEFRQNTWQFAHDNGQQSIWDARKGEAISTGSTGDTVLTNPKDLFKALGMLQRGEAVDVGDLPIMRQREEETTGEQGGFDFLKSLAVRDPRHPSNMTRAEVAKEYPEVYLPKNRDELVDISGLDESPLFKSAENEEAAVKQIGEKLVAEYRAKKHIPEVQDGEKWYSRFVPLLEKHFGADSHLMAELLAATSPRNNPTVNFQYATEALWKFKDGHYDGLIKKFLEGLNGLPTGETRKQYEADLKEGQVANPKPNPSDAAVMAHWIDKYGLKPTKANDKLFGATSDAVMQVLARVWMNEGRGPKVGNFVKNLLGVGHRATIDVWAGRLLRRLSHEGYVDKWRVLPANDAGISDRNFDLGQRAFDYAAEKLGIEADALQGALWFSEKKHWADKGWQRLNLGDYATEMKKLPELRRKYEGKGDPDRPTLFSAQREIELPHPTDKAQLESLFTGKGDNFWGVHEDPDLGGAAFKSSGRSATECTGFACEIRNKLGRNRVSIWGFSESDNPTSEIAKSAGGHDFALVDERFIVDPWLSEVESLSDRSVFDLQNPQDHADISRLYGSTDAWKPVRLPKDKREVRQNAWGGLRGYENGRFVKEFSSSSEQELQDWKNFKNSAPGLRKPLVLRGPVAEEKKVAIEPRYH